MRPGFEQTLRNFSEVAKDELKKSPGEELGDLSKVIDWHLDKAAEKYGNTPKIQRSIYELQKEKQKIMERLKSDLACLDNTECDFERQEGERQTGFDSESKTFDYQDDLGRDQTATFGEILTDMDLGVNYHYHLDKKSVPRTMLKKYLIERTKKELMRLLNLQIIRGGDAKSGGNPMRVLRWRYETPSSQIERLQKKNSGDYGFVAEIIVENFLRQLAVDYNLPFEIKTADVYQDVEEKIDFIIHRKKRYRGVEVEADASHRNIGIQFTIKKGEKIMLHKKRQIDEAMEKLAKEGGRIQDIVLVRVPLKMIDSLYAKYESEGRTAGGLNKFLHQDTAKRLWFKLTKAILTDEESAAYWEKIRDKFSA